MKISFLPTKRRIDAFANKKSAKLARAIQRAEQSERDAAEIPGWREKPEFLGSKKFLAGSFVVTAFLGVFYLGMSLYNRMIDNSLDYIHSKIPIGQMELCRRFDSRDRQAYINGEFNNIELNQMFEDGLFLDNLFMRGALEDDFYRINRENLRDNSKKCRIYNFPDFSKDGKITLPDGEHPLDAE